MITHARHLVRLSVAVCTAVVSASLLTGCSDSPAEPVVAADVDGTEGDDSSESNDVDGTDSDVEELPDTSLPDSDEPDVVSVDGDADDGSADDAALPDAEDVAVDGQDDADGVDTTDGAEVVEDTLDDTLDDVLDDAVDADGSTDDALEPADTEPPVDAGPLYDAPLGIWSTAASLPAGRERAAFATHGGAIWVAGGSDTLGAAKQDFYVFSVSGGVWGIGKTLPTARHSAIAAVASGRLYVAGGKDTLGAALQVVERYNPGDQSWVSPPLPQLPTAGASAASVGVGKALWAVGGDGGATLVRSFDPAEGVWSTEAPLAHGRSYPAVAHLPGPDGFGGELVVFGGASTSAPASGDPLVTIVERYSFETGAWSEAGEAPFARHGLAAAAWGGRIWTFGGTDENGLVRDTIWVWDPALGFAVGQTMPRPRSFHGALSTVEGIWLVGGRYATPSGAGANVALELQVDRLTF